MLKVGKVVGFLHEKGTAEIIEIRGKTILIRDSDGFDREVLSSELIEIHSLNFDNIPVKANSESELEKAKGIIKSRQEEKVLKSKQHQGIVEWELDLHIEELVDSISGLNATDMILKQLSSLKHKFNAAKNQRVNRLIVIHGVGEGVLKNEIRSFLAKQEGIEILDADFRKYGHGATLVVFHPNW